MSDVKSTPASYLERINRQRLLAWCSLVPRGGFAAQVLTLSSGTILAQAGMIATSPILSRLYGPGEFAEFALYSLFSNLAAIVATGRYELALMLPERDDDACSVLVLAMLLPFAAMSVAGLGVGAYSVLAGGETASWLWLVPPGALMLAWYYVAARWQARKKRFRFIACAEIVATVLALAIQLTAGAVLTAPSGLPLILGQIIGRGLCLPILCTGMISDWSNHTLPFRLRGVVATALRYRRFPLFTCAASLLGKANQELPKLLLAGMFGPHVLGLFSLSMRVLGTPTSLIGQAFGEAFFPRIAEYRADRHRAERLMLRACCQLSLLILLPALVLFFWAEWIFAVVFGPEWAESGVYARLLIPLFVAQFIVQPIALSLQAFEKQRAVLVWQCCLMVVLLAALIGGKWFGDVETALFSYGLAFASMLTIYLAMSLYFARQLGAADTDSLVASGEVKDAVGRAA